MRPRLNPFTDFSDLEGGRNPSYLNSVYLGFERGVFRAPGSLLVLVGWPIATIVMCLGYIVVGLVLWAACRVCFVVQGCLGLLRRRPTLDSKSALTGHGR